MESWSIPRIDLDDGIPILTLTSHFSPHHHIQMVQKASTSHVISSCTTTITIDELHLLPSHQPFDTDTTPPESHGPASYGKQIEASRQADYWLVMGNHWPFCIDRNYHTLYNTRALHHEVCASDQSISEIVPPCILGSEDSLKRQSPRLLLNNFSLREVNSLETLSPHHSLITALGYHAQVALLSHPQVHLPSPQAMAGHVQSQHLFNFFPR